MQGDTMQEENTQTHNLNSEDNPVSLEINDLALMLQILNVVTERGAIRAKEMSTVGQLYAKLEAFVKAHAPVKSEDPEATSDNTEPKETTNNG